MGEALPEGVSRQEFDGLKAELTGAVGELREALDELRTARTEPERRDAQEGVRDAKADLALVARELGIDPKRLEKAASDAKASDEREHLRGIVAELLDEELEVPDPKEAVEELAGKGGLPDPKPEAKPEPKPDSAPGGNSPHWSERPLSALFGGGSDG